MKKRYDERIIASAGVWVASFRSNCGRNVVLICVSLCLCAPLFGATNTVYLSQSGGAFSGGSLCNGQSAQAYTYFNSSKNWTSATPSGAQIGPGTLVVLCGTIGAAAGSTALTFQGGGSSGNPITLEFDTGSSLQEAYFGSGGAINVGNNSYITINGQNVGVIEATLNGTSGASCPGGPCAYQQNSDGIENLGGNSTVENLTIEDMYVHTSTSDEAFDALSIDCMDISNQGHPSNVTVTGNTAHDCLTGVGFWWNGNGGSNYVLSSNTIYRTCWGADVIEGGNGTTYSGVYIFGNHIYDHSNWADASQACHSNAIHLFQANNCSTCVVNGIYIYNNEIDGPANASDTTAQIYFDNNGGSANFTNGYLFNNVISWANGDCSGTCDAQLALASGTWSFYNNSLICNATSSTLQGEATQVYQVTLSADENNVTTGCTTEIEGKNSGSFTTLNYNLYTNSGSSAFAWQGTYYGTGQFSSWKSSSGEGSSSSYQASNILPLCNSITDCSNVIPATGSAVINAGTNLYSTCNGQPNPGLGALCYDKAGTARLSTGNWDAGAYQHTAGTLGSPSNVGGSLNP
jgi:hypothetical protein